MNPVRRKLSSLLIETAHKDINALDPQSVCAKAVKDTIKGAAGLGISAGLGVAAANAVVGSAVAFGSTVVVPIGAGFAAGYITMKIWNGIFPRGKETS